MSALPDLLDARDADPRPIGWRVGCLGNMNNNFFSLVRHLRDRGVAAELLLLHDEEGARAIGLDHFHPSADTFCDKHLEYVRQLDWHRRGVLSPGIGEVVRSDTRAFDILFGLGYAPAFMRQAGRPLDFFVPYGSDLYEYPFEKLTARLFLQLLKRRLVEKRPFPRKYRIAPLQRKGIQSARRLITSNADFYPTIAGLGVGARFVKTPMPVIYTPDFNPGQIRRFYAQSKQYPEFRRIRESHQVVLLHHARHVWKTRLDAYSWKGNDKLIRGFAAALKRTPVRACLVMLEYGPDVEASKQLVAELGIAEAVRWFPRMERKEIMVGLSLSDICGSEYALSWLSGGTIYEALAMARPLLGFRTDSDYAGEYPALYPMMNVHTAEEITAALLDYLARPEHYRQMGEQGRKWLQQYVIDEPLRKIMDLMAAIPRPENSARVKQGTP
jgi:glycosyltransferase involved in cell wall biosynthesis